MKALLIFILSFYVSVAANAQSDSSITHKNLPPDNALGLIPKIDPMFLRGLFLNTTYYEFSLEKEFLKHESFQLTYEYIYSKTANTSTPMQTNSYLSIINPEFRYYFNKSLSHSSFFAGAGMVYVISKSLYEVISYENKFAAGINFGGRLIYKRIVFDACFGLNANFPILPPTSTYMSDAFFRVVFGIGYRF